MEALTILFTNEWMNNSIVVSPNFQIVIANGGIMKCGGCCENVRLQLGDYHLKNHMFSIDMGAFNIFLGA